VADALNAFHNTHHSLRYWNIVLGHWLKRYVAVIFNRYFTLEQVLGDHELSGTTVFDATDYRLVTANSLSFIWASNDDIFNHVLYAKILSFWGNVKAEMDHAPLAGIRGFVQEENFKTVQVLKVRDLIINVVNYILPKFSCKRDAFIIGSYMPRIEEVKLQLSLGQCPQFWQSPALKNAVLDPEKNLRFSIDAENFQGFEQFVRLLLGESIPTCYLEGYDQLVQHIKSLPWPAEPRFIFTSNNFDTDEIFKAWAGSKVEEGFPYFTGQHGNNYGTHICDGNSDWPERKSSDKFITWGWADESKNSVPAFIFKTMLKKKQQFNQKGGLLLIENLLYHKLYTHDIYYEYKLYQEEQFRFVEILPIHIQRELTVRLHPAFRHMAWCDEQRWRDRSPHTKIEVGVVPIQELIEHSRLVIHSYDSTGILETLSLNIPTICFWYGGLDQLLPSAKPYYELLRIAGILADTPEQAAELIASHWDNVSEWWGSQKVQDARKTFCGQYAKMEKNPAKELKKLLTQNAKWT
jgi:putative transferase (TIGR04331 family)